MASRYAYEPVLSSKAAAFLVGLPKRRQRALVELLFQLANDPFQIGDYAENEGTGREVRFILVGDFVIAFWADHPVKELRIVDVEEV